MKNKTISTSQWLQDKLVILDKMTDTLRAISPEVYTIVDHDYGFWSLKKEIALMYLARPFQNIAKNHFSSYYYIDLFAGSGLMKVADDTFYVGSPVVAIGSTLKEKPFSKYICIEADQNRCKVLQQRLDAACTHYQTCKADVVPADTNAEIGNVLQKYAPKGDTCFLAFVDPEKYTDIDWSTLETLMRFGKGDIILNFPSHSIVRNLPTEKSAGAVASLSKFVGDSDWASQLMSLDDFLNYFKAKMHRYRQEVQSITLYGEGRKRLFDLVFATDSIGMNNSLQDLNKRLEKIKTKTIKGLSDVAVEKQSQLSVFG